MHYSQNNHFVKYYFKGAKYGILPVFLAGYGEFLGVVYAIICDQAL